LNALATHGRIGADEAETLANAYVYYRQIEHRLQMVDDRQTHSLPDNADAIDNVAQLHGLANADALLASLRPHIDKVGHIYDSLSDDGNTGFTQDPELMLERCTALGFPDPAATSARITSWRTDRVRCLRTPAAREAFEAMLPNLLAALGKAPDPTSAVNRFDNLLTRIPTGINLFRLLEARPALATLLANILGLAPALAEDLARRPALLEGLIDARAFEPDRPRSPISSPNCVTAAKRTRIISNCSTASANRSGTNASPWACNWSKARPTRWTWRKDIAGSPRPRCRC